MVSKRRLSTIAKEVFHGDSWRRGVPMGRSWISKPRYSREYVSGVEGFLDFAFSRPYTKGVVKCPCLKCSFKKCHTRDVMFDHLICNGFPLGYTIWLRHGEDLEDDAPPNPIVEQVKEGGSMQDLSHDASRNDLWVELTMIKKKLEILLKERELERVERARERVERARERVERARERAERARERAERARERVERARERVERARERAELARMDRTIKYIAQQIRIQIPPELSHEVESPDTESIVSSTSAC